MAGADAPRPTAAAVLGRPAVFWPLAAALAVAGAVPQFLSRLTPDAAWYLYVARRVLDGARLYVDVHEINPPLIVALSAPAAAIGAWTGLADIQLFRAFALLLVACSLAAAGTLLRRLPGPAARGAVGAIVLLWLFALLPLTRDDFGQREHLLLALALPYLAAASLRGAGERPPRGLALLAGVMAGLGMALKPHFALLWLGVEAYLWARARRGPPWRRVESALAAAVPALYGVLVVLLTPAYLDLVRHVGGAYGAYLRNSPLAILVHEPWAALPVVALIATLALRPADVALARLAELLAVAAAALLLAALAQQKGWRYHLYPAFATATVLLGVLVLVPRADAGSLGARTYAAIARLLVAGVVAATLAGAVRQAARPRDARYEPYPEFPVLLDVVRAHRERGGGALLALSNNLRAAFPLVNYGGVPWASRFNATWLLAVSYAPELMSGRPLVYRDRAAMGPAERFLNDAMFEDMARARPTLLIVERPLPAGGNPVRRLDYLAYFRRDPRLARLLADFRKIRDVGDFEVYERVAPSGAP